MLAAKHIGGQLCRNIPDLAQYQIAIALVEYQSAPCVILAKQYLWCTIFVEVVQYVLAIGKLQCSCPSLEFVIVFVFLDHITEAILCKIFRGW